MNPIYSIAALFIVLVVLAKVWSWAKPANETSAPSDARPSVNPMLGALVGFAAYVTPFSDDDFDRTWREDGERYYAYDPTDPASIHYSQDDH